MEKGQLIDDRFKVVELIGKGGQGEVYLVEDVIENNLKRALKKLRTEFLPKDLDRMKKEVLALKNIGSDRVIPITATNLDEYEHSSEQVPYFVMEFARYGTLNKHNYYKGEIELSLRLFRNICEGVSDIHEKGVIHRDLKPSNILLVENEKDLRVSDFGICYIDLEDDKKRATKIREKVGPMYFAAPEQTSLPPTFSKRSDIYSLGRLLHFLITGIYEFSPGDDYVPVTVQLGLKDAHPVDDLIKKMISFDPKGRPDDVRDVIREIDKLLGIKEEKSPLRLTKLQKRILKYVESDRFSGARIEEILDYISNFYDIERGTEFTPPALRFLSGKMSWSQFAELVENSLEQLEEAGILTFKRGEYSLSES
ncbi:MAG: hypothetical protein AMJ89_05220 [candidate division Zixibacteria bacterium SM23_73]|nr:MAG: hypothetical protein AMJ89_05220 [candidate division Zixibacteria bacterium SM23_73]